MNDIHLYTASTMNGWKPVIFMEEAGVDYDITHVDFSRRQQKSAEYLAINPNGRIPSIIDRSNNNFTVIESGAILWYLAKKYQMFLPSDISSESEVLQWVMFQMGGIGPMMGQAMFFQRIAPKHGEHNAYAIERYTSESRRLLEVLNTRLRNRTFLVGEVYTIADMATYPWARAYHWAKVDISGLTHLQAWLDRIDQREATQRALTIPEPFDAFFGKGELAQQEQQEQANADRF